MPLASVSASRVFVAFVAVALATSGTACGGSAAEGEDSGATFPLPTATAPPSTADGSGFSASNEHSPETASPTPSPATPRTTPTAAEAAVSTFDGTPEVARAMGHLRHLSVTIGPRPAGSDAEREAADYIADQLRASGYDAQIEEFTFDAQRDDSSVTLPDGTPIRALVLEGSPNAQISGRAAHGGLGRPQDLAGAGFEDHVVIFDRGEVTFGDKARAAEAAGASAVIIVNDEPGMFRGALGELDVMIPVVSVSGEYADVLEEAVGERVTVLADAGRAEITSQNVVAHLAGSGEVCRAYLGAHYDSVAVSPGANDNASGTAVVLELARVNRIEGLCVILFGAEELGLFGSQDYVASHLAGTARFMLNVDMAGRLDGPNIVGSSSVTNDLLDAIRARGVGTSFIAGTFPPFASSDHVSFEAVGVPAVTINSGEDAAIHTAQDTIERIDERALEGFLAAVDAGIDALQEEHADVLMR